ncbi:MAG: tetratricopeptide repeat protein, partial [Deltaproteobacteria bacterium]|nr:tetratricopeptide repeat protein [Deltaproteobacteria bacterium]
MRRSAKGLIRGRRLPDGNFTDLAVVLAVTLSVLAGFLIAAGCGGDRAKKKDRFLLSGQEYYDKGKYAEAVIQFKNAIQMDSQSAIAHYKLGLSQLKLGNMPEAYREFSLTLDLDPKMRDAQIQMGNFHLLFNQPQEARRIAQSMLKRDPEDWH